MGEVVGDVECLAVEWSVNACDSHWVFLSVGGCRYAHVMTELKGSNGAISFDGRTVSITRKGLGAAFFGGNKGEKTIPLNSITSVQYKKSGMLVGYIQLAVSGDSQRGGKSTTQSIQQDENAVCFYAKQNDAFKALADEINAALLAKHEPVAAAPDLADQLQKLAGLRDQGILTEEEFAAKKADLLARL